VLLGGAKDLGKKVVNEIVNPDSKLRHDILPGVAKKLKG